MHSRPAPLLALACLLACCADGVPEAPPNVLLISIDTLRADRLGCYGATAVETPALDALAKRGVRFENAFTPVPLTLPAHWTLHTGVEPWHHGVVDNGMTPAGAPAATLAERLSAAGYETAAFVASFVLHSTFGLDRGFALYDDGPAADAALDQLGHATAPADERVGRALRWLQKSRAGGAPPARPFFLWLHLFDPHAPYQPPSDFRARYADRPYDGEVAFVDTQIARLMAGLERLGEAERTLIVVTADHGEGLGEHGERTHGLLLYDGTLRVPLIFRLPQGRRAGQVRPDAATLADVAPTVLALAGLATEPAADGRDLFGKDGREPRLLGAIAESPRRRFSWASLIALRDAEWKYIGGPRPELYHYAEDRREERDLLAAETQRGDELARGARAIERALGSDVASHTAEPNAEERAALAALGYVGGRPDPGAARPPNASLPNPKDVIASMDALDRAFQLFAEGKLEQAEASFRSLVDSDLPPAAALEGLARVARLRGRNAEAEAAYLRLIDTSPESVAAWAQLVLLARERGDLESALERARKLSALAPRDGAASRLLAETLLAAGDPAGAEAEWRKGLAAAPRAGWLRLSFARFLHSSGRQGEALAELDRLLAADSLPDDLRAAAEGLGREARIPPLQP
jgi:choline-sulfatase